MYPFLYSSLLVSWKCLLLVSCVSGMMNETLRNKFLKLHNDVRQAVRNGQIDSQPIAVSIGPLKYNLELEKKAQMLSDECRVGHDSAEERQIPLFPYVGQNWAGAANVEM
ncbi:unnamed protein product [Trichobilharzia regenti]|nr:unnamed protein product [Trichobilharzia regenti]